MKTGLTERQNQAYEFIRSFMREHRKPPTLKEIGEALDMRSTNGVSKMLHALQSKGYIEREQNKARGMRLVGNDIDAFAPEEELPNLPLISRTASDQPELLRQRPKRYITVDPSFFGKRDDEKCIMCLAGDDGMNRAGIYKGDYLIVEEVPWQQIRNDTVVAFLVREEVRVRHFFHANGRIHLRPADRHYTEETYPPNDPECYIIGRVIALTRRLL